MNVSEFDEAAFVKKLRDVCAAFPEANECLSFGHPTWKGGKRLR